MHIDKQALESSFYLFCFWVYCDGWLVGPMMGGWTNRVCEVSLVGRAGGRSGRSIRPGDAGPSVMDGFRWGGYAIGTN